MDPCPVLVGREQELSVLRSLLEAGGGVAIVSGEAGIGKSRLVREFSSLAADAGRVVLWARPEEVAQPGPYALIVDLLESIAERCGSGVKKDVRGLVAELTRTDTDGQRPAPSPRAVAAEVRGLVAQLGSPPLVVMEDLHWADEQSHSVVLHLMRAAHDDRHVVVATLRPERGKSEASLARLQDTLSRERVATEIVLSPLDSNGMAEMLELIWRRPPTEAEVADLSKLGEGIPFFIEELATSRPSDGPGRVPRSIEQSVAARVAELGDEAATVLRAASLMTGALDVAVLALATDVPEHRAAEHLTAAARVGLLVDNEDRLVFRHSLAREAIASGLVSVEAAQTHGRLAAAIKKVHAGELDSFAGALADHYRMAGEKKSAVEFAICAGERALAFAATEDARAAFASALEMDRESLDAKRGLAEVEFRDGNESAAAALFRHVADKLKLMNEGPAAANALSRLSWALQGQVGPQQVIDVLDEALELVGSDESARVGARLMVQKGSIQCFLLNQTASARPTLTKALEIAEQASDVTLVAEALDGLAQADELEGDLATAILLGERAIENARASGSAEVVGRTHNNYALKLAISGQPGAGLKVLATGRDYIKREHGRAALGALDVSQAWISWLMGLPNEVAQLTARGRVSWQRWRGYRWILETWSYVERGEQSRAAAAIEEAWTTLGVTKAEALGDQTEWTRDTTAAICSDILLALSDGRAAESIDAAEAITKYAREHSERFDFGQLLVIKGRAMMAAGLRPQADHALKELVALLVDFGYPYLEALAFELRALIAREDQQSGAAVEHLQQAILLLQRCENQSDLARCERLLAEELIAGGEPHSLSTARDHLKHARSLAEESGAIVELNTIESIGRSMGLRLRSGRRRGKVDPKALSPREIEVASLVAEGETNVGIARRLFLSDRTVQDHITHALKKLNLSSRAALASWAARNGLL